MSLRTANSISAEEYADYLRTGQLPARLSAKRTASPEPVASAAKKRTGRAPSTAGAMNKTEAAYAGELESRRLAGSIAGWLFEPLNLRLAKNTFYRPDFLVVTHAGPLEIHEVKGHWEDDARVKVKVAAERFWMFRFVALRRKGGAWIVEEF